MKAWEKQLADLFLLADDIFENISYQPPEFKVKFYYAFNHNLHFNFSDGSFKAQRKLLQQLESKGALSFTDQQPTKETPKELIGRNALSTVDSKFVLLRLKPLVFYKVHSELSKHRPKDLDTGDTDGGVILRLIKPDNRLLLKSNIDVREHPVYEFRTDMDTDLIFSWLINTAHGARVNRTQFETQAHVHTNRKYNQIINKSMGPLLREQFVLVNKPDVVQLRTEVATARPQYEFILAEIYKST